MYFSDEIFLIKEKMVKDKLGQFQTAYEETPVWSDLGSISSTEKSEAGVNGHKAQARATIYTDEYSGQKLVRVPEGIPVLGKGVYEVYRTYLSGSTMELYLKEKEGL